MEVTVALFATVVAIGCMVATFRTDLREARGSREAAGESDKPAAANTYND